MNTYSTRTEAIQREIIDPINAGEADAADFDIDAIAEAAISLCYVGEYQTPAFRCTVEPDEFWQIVAHHAI